MLWAYTHVLPDVVHLCEEVFIEDATLASRLRQEPSQHGDCGGLSCAIVPQKREDLTVVHLQVDSIHGFEVVRVCFGQV